TPASWEDALTRIRSVIAYMAGEQPESAMPFLLSNALRTAELHEALASGQIDSMSAPPTELRQTLKRGAAEGEWSEVHRAALAALATPCGTGWLDLFRYLWTASRELGWNAQQGAIAGALQQRLREYPMLTGLTLDDDTPAANGETLRWIAEEIAPPVPDFGDVDESPAPTPTPTLEAVLARELDRAEEPAPEDLFVTARGLAAHGQIQAAIQLLARDAAHQSVGRIRFGRNLQIAELCLESGNSAVAVPVLQGLVREVEERRLESWEPPDSAARPYALLLQCASVAKLDAQSIFARLCAIDPGAALTMAPPVES
ncbi:MAG TPA: type VI secretion system domain-containing protein, partial [Acidobacteriaceae bacterium]